MSQQDNFIGGFLLGTLVGGVVGGIAGVLVSSRLPNDATESEAEVDSDPSQHNTNRPFQLPTERSIEIARQSLEDKIAQLNNAIDDVRAQLSTVNARPASSNGDKVIQD